MHTVNIRLYSVLVSPHLQSPIISQLLRIVHNMEWIEHCMNFPGVKTPPNFGSHIIADLYSVRLELLQISDITPFTYLQQYSYHIQNRRHKHTNPITSFIPYYTMENSPFPPRLCLIVKVITKALIALQDCTSTQFTSSHPSSPRFLFR